LKVHIQTNYTSPHFYSNQGQTNKPTNPQNSNNKKIMTTKKKSKHYPENKTIKSASLTNTHMSFKHVKGTAAFRHHLGQYFQ